jgi:hypothetical protein
MLKNLLLAGLIILLTITNPGKDEYINWAKQNLVAKTSNPIERIGISVLAAPMLDATTKRQDLVLLSLYKTSLGNRDYTVIGILGNFVALHK